MQVWRRRSVIDIGAKVEGPAPCFDARDFSWRGSSRYSRTVRPSERLFRTRGLNGFIWFSNSVKSYVFQKAAPSTRL